MTTWILLRGLTRESGHWGAFPALLQRRLPPTATVVTLDLPGNGASNRTRSPASIGAMTQHCRERLRASGIDPPYALLAMSLGAMVAVDWAARHPHELSGCVLVNTSLRPFDPWYQRLRPGNYARLIALALTPGSEAAHERAILRMTSRNAAAAERVLADWTRLRQAHPVSTCNALRQLWAAARFRAPASPPDVPLLVLGSRRDALVDPRCSQQLARRWQTGLSLHAEAGHDLPLDDGPWVAEQIGRWLAARSAP